MQDLNDLYYYVQVLDHRGFAPAGRALGMPKSKLSRRIALLEARLGVRLIQRSTRQFSVTPIGQSFYERCQAMLIEAEAAQDVVELTQTEPRGIVRMSCPIALLHANVATMLADFLLAHPLVRVYLEATNRRADPIGESIDIAIRVRPPPLEDSDLVLRVLADRCQCLVASPALVTQHPLPKTPGDLASWPSLGLGTSGQNHVWRLLGPDGASVQQPHQPRFVTSDECAARRGTGWRRCGAVALDDGRRPIAGRFSGARVTWLGASRRTDSCGVPVAPGFTTLGARAAGSPRAQFQRDCRDRRSIGGRHRTGFTRDWT